MSEFLDMVALRNIEKRESEERERKRKLEAEKNRGARRIAAPRRRFR